MPVYYAFHFTPAEADQLASYVSQRDQGHESGWYYGNKEQFEKRHKRITEELQKRSALGKEVRHE